jgi:hypothetical protein
MAGFVVEKQVLPAAQLAVPFGNRTGEALCRYLCVPGTPMPARARCGSEPADLSGKPAYGSSSTAGQPPPASATFTRTSSDTPGPIAGWPTGSRSKTLCASPDSGVKLPELEKLGDIQVVPDAPVDSFWRPHVKISALGEILLVGRAALLVSTPPGWEQRLSCLVDECRSRYHPVGRALGVRRSPVRHCP